MQFMTKYALYDHNLGVHTEVESLCNGCDKIFRNKTKLANHNRAHIKLRTALIVMSNLVRFNAFIILQRKATWGHTRKECARNPSKTLLSLCMVRVTTELTPSLTWTDTVRSAKLWIQVPSITLANRATRRFLQRSGSPPVWISNSNVSQKKQTSSSTDLCVGIEF